MQQPFHIRFERTGGFTGVPLTLQLDSRSLEPGEADSVENLIEHSGFFNFLEMDSAGSGHPDQFQYSLTIKYRGKEQTAAFKSSAITEDIRPLIDYLTRKARTKSNP